MCKLACKSSLSFNSHQSRGIFRKHLIISLLLLMSGLGLSFTLAVYEEVTPLPYPTQWPANIQPLTIDNLPQLSLTNMLNGGIATDTVWYSGDNNQLAINTTNGVWFYDLRTSSNPRLVVRDLISFDYWRADKGRLSFSPDGKWFTSATGYDKRLGDHEAARLIIWDTATGKNYPLQPYDPIAPGFGLIFACQYEPCPLRYVGWLPDNTLIKVMDNAVTVWRHLPADESEVFAYPSTNRTGYSIEHLAVSSDSHRVALILRANISDQAIIHVWNIRTGEGTTLYADDYLPLGRLEFSNLTFTGDGSLLQATLHSGEVWQWEANTLERKVDIPAHKLTCLSNEETKTLAEKTQIIGSRLICMEGRNTGFPENILRILDLTSGKLLSETDLDSSNTIIGTSPTKLAMAYPSAVVGGRKPYQNPYTVPIWDLTTGQKISVIHTADWPARAIFSPDESQVAITGVEGGTSIWNVNHPDGAIPLLNNHHGPIYGMAFSADEGRLMVLSEQELAAYSPQDSTSHIVLGDPAKKYRSLASDNGSRLAIGDEDGSIQLMDWASEKVTSVLSNNDAALAMAFTPDGKTLTVFGYKSLHFWDVAQGKLINRLPYSTYDDLRVPNTATFTPDGRWLVYRGDVWQIEQSGRLVAQSNLESIAYEYPVFSNENFEYQLRSYDFNRGFYVAASLGSVSSPTRVFRISDQQLLWADLDASVRSAWWRVAAISEHWIATGSTAGSIEIYAIKQDQ